MINPLFNFGLPLSVRWNIARAYGGAIRRETTDATLGTAAVVGAQYGAASANIKAVSTGLKIAGAGVLLIAAFLVFKKVTD